MRTILMLAATCFLALPALGQQAEPEVRGTWMTTTANDAIASPAKTAESMKRLRSIGLNTVYVETWKNGYTQFPSEVLYETIGVDRRPALVPMDPSDPPERYRDEGRDLLQETLIEAHRNQLIYIAWFEYGFMAAFKDTDNHLRRMKPEWLTTTIDGELVSDQNPFVWMNPLHPEARDFLMGIMLEAVDKYDLDGVQLDDRIAWPVTMGYDPYTVAQYKLEHKGAEPPADPRDPDWIRWRAEKVGDFAERFYKELKEKRPHLIVSVSPAIYDWSLTNYSCDWKTWSRRGWMDEYIPQVYRFNYETYARDWPAQMDAAGPDRLRDLISGIRVVGEGADTTWPEMVQKINLPRETMTGGHVHWFSRGVLDVYEQELTGFYDVANQGHSPHPKLGMSWRPAPVVAEAHADDLNVWTVTVTDPGQYRVIAHNGETWEVVESRFFYAGEHTLEITDAAAVELLVDRR
ncbi:glycoside hydrolase family 10 protein [Mucisphaera sp.]|uniref:glycoside hydrolase family 10 protein n=1 Tax=Mucisphaera sp. TaxID=2913024 RepID=UPI003D11B878